MGGSRTDWNEALGRQSGRAYWRSVEELLDTPEFREAVAREFPAGAAELANGMSRRDFVRLLGASMALAGVGGCTEPPAETILPYVLQPAETTRGFARHYATSMTIDGYATGLLVESNAGRPIKIEGNPQHPASLGAAGVHEQASLLGVYDPHRSRRFRSPGPAADWPAFARSAAAVDGEGLCFLLEPVSSPLVQELIADVRSRHPGARFFFDAPTDSGATLEGARAVFGQPLLPRYEFGLADVILACDADFLGTMPFHLRYGRDFATRRQLRSPAGTMNRLYAVEGSPSVTGATADHRLQVPVHRVQVVLAAVLAEVLNADGMADTVSLDATVLQALLEVRAGGAHAEWVRAVAADLRARPGRSLVVVGPRQPPQAHVLAYLLNQVLGNTGRTVSVAPSPILEAAEPGRDLSTLMQAMAGGAVRTLVILDANPAYTGPAEAEFTAALDRVPTTIYCGLHENETAARCNWFIPGAHYLETWGDARAWDGTLSLIQPLIAPLYGGRTPAEVVAAFTGRAPASAHELLQQSWRGRTPGPDFDAAWQDLLGRGLADGSAFSPLARTPQWSALAGALADVARAQARQSAGLEIVFSLDPSVHDGRFANNAWLQELPDPMTKLTWGNAATLSPAMAARIGVESGDMLTLRYRGRSLRAPALVLPGHADESVTLALGYGRSGAERTARGVGVDAYRLRTAAAPYFDTGLVVERAPGREELATTQTHWALRGRPVALQTTLEQYRQRPHFTREQRGRALSLYRPYAYDEGDQWAMVIDLSLCTGCSACVVACQAENNVPVVGRQGVLESREMHWLRLDRYFTGDAAEPGTVFQPMLCQHCEQAPCEYVCPVNATVHSPDGLNEMVYNRCVGTRFCSNNCPYKVRRFNWYDYSADREDTEVLAANPDVTVRERGVMEKCTFCVQRIRQAQIDRRMGMEGGEVQTACQQTCPTRAIVFGSYTDPNPELEEGLRDPRRYSALHHLGTEPRVKYLARITNPNPELGSPPE